MTMEKGQAILISDFINAINAGLKDKIQTNAKWSASAPPPNATNTVKARLQPNTTLTQMTATDKVNKGQVITFSTVYDAVQTLFRKWCCVRKFNYTYKWGGWSNGGGIPWNQQTYSNYAHLKSMVGQNIVQQEAAGLDLSGQPIMPDSAQKICDKLYEAWQNIATQYHEDIMQTSCHRNCHGSCHGSGGRR